MKYSLGLYDKSNDTEQWIRITEGCPNNCEFCYEPKEQKIFDIPEIVRNKVRVMDMNLLCKPEALDIINELGRKRVNGKVVYYELICGIDHRFLTQELASALRRNRFKNVKLAWDFGFNLQIKIEKSINYLIYAGYRPDRDITIFMICNWKTPVEENFLKMDLCKVWNVKISDCWYDNQLSPDIKPIHWAEKDIKLFRKKVRKHNQMVLFRIDPELHKRKK